MYISKIKIGNDTYDILTVLPITISDVTKAIYNELYGSTTKPNGASVITNQNLSSAVLNTVQILTTSDITSAVYTELYSSSTKPNNAFAITNQNLLSTLQSIGIDKNIAYNAVQYSISRINGSGALTIPGTDPVYVVTVTDNISSVTLQNNPSYGHSCHVIFKSADNSSRTVFIGNDNVNRICPTSDGVILTIPAIGTGYVEVDFLNTGNTNIGDEVYVRGV